MRARAAMAALAVLLAAPSAAAQGGPDPRFAAISIEAADFCIASFRAGREQEGLECFRPLVGICPRTLPADATMSAALDCIEGETQAWEARLTKLPFGPGQRWPWGRRTVFIIKLSVTLPVSSNSANCVM